MIQISFQAHLCIFLFCWKQDESQDFQEAAAVRAGRAQWYIPWRRAAHVWFSVTLQYPRYEESQDKRLSLMDGKFSIHRLGDAVSANGAPVPMLDLIYL